MTNPAFIPIHKVVCEIEGATNIEIDETLTFEKNGHHWEVFALSKVSAVPFLLHKDGRPTIGFTQPESIKEFFVK